jgi:hypothetical protein
MHLGPACTCGYTKANIKAKEEPCYIEDFVTCKCAAEKKLLHEN